MLEEFDATSNVPTAGIDGAGIISNADETAKQFDVAEA